MSEVIFKQYTRALCISLCDGYFFGSHTTHLRASNTPRIVCLLIYHITRKSVRQLNIVAHFHRSWECLCANRRDLEKNTLHEHFNQVPSLPPSDALPVTEASRGLSTVNVHVGAVAIMLALTTRRYCPAPVPFTTTNKPPAAWAVNECTLTDPAFTVYVSPSGETLDTGPKYEVPALSYVITSRSLPQTWLMSFEPMYTCWA